ncbi:MAG TPA: thiamine phosphate synthase [Terriglobia bacterium]|nr:thiamine phosphate synthase [Terriglobia bacterium]
MSRHILYYITDRTAFPGTESERRLRLLLKIAEATRAGIDFIQLREKDLSTRHLELLARDALQILRDNARSGNPTRLLINSRTDVALAVDAHGVHLRSDDVTVSEARNIWRHAGRTGQMTLAVSCHSSDEVERAADERANFAVFAPVFEKKDNAGQRAAGIDALRRASDAAIPVLALGGVTLANWRDCVEAGASGIAAIRLFQENEVAEVVRQLRAQ